MERDGASFRDATPKTGRSAAAWWMVAAVCWGGTLLSLPGYYRWFVDEPLQRAFSGAALVLSIGGGLASLVSALTSLGMGTFLYLRKGAERGPRLVSFFLLLYGFLMAGPVESIEFFFDSQSRGLSMRAQMLFFTVPVWFMLLTFPNGIITPKSSRWLIPFSALTIPVMLVLSLPEIKNISTPRSRVVFAYLGVLLVLAVAAQVYRYFWVSSLVERQQTKLVMYGVMVQVVLFIISGTLYVQDPYKTGYSVSPGTTLMALLWWGAMGVLPVAITLAVVRARLWDIDLVIRRTLVYGFLSLMLALAYYGGVIFLQAVFRLIAGHESPLAVILSTLGIAALFNPLRRRTQALIDRRFFRSRYDSEQALAAFQHSLRVRVDFAQVENDLTETVRATVQPEWVALWIKKQG